MHVDREGSRGSDRADDFRQLTRHTGYTADRLRRDFVIERLLVRLLEDSPDRWMRFDDWRLEYRVDGPSAADAFGDVSAPARAAVDAALRRASAFRGLDRVNVVVRAGVPYPQVPEGPALAYEVEAFDHDGAICELDLTIGFAFPPADEIEWLPGLELPAAQDGPLPQIPTRSRVTQLAARLGAYTGRTSRFPSYEDLLTIARYAPQVMCTADRMRRALDRVWPWTATPAWPLAVPAPPPWWADAYRDGAFELGLASALAVGHAWAAALLDPILSGTVPPGATWEPGKLRWAPPDRHGQSD
ncbi:MAG: hypothetical protein OXG64_07140 [Chloroflexi bacterium]|nr:hypothetical protein [Chloroflexota bacterium]